MRTIYLSLSCRPGNPEHAFVLKLRINAVIRISPDYYRMKNRDFLTTHDIIKLNILKRWNFCLEFERWSVSKENGLKRRSK